MQKKTLLALLLALMMILSGCSLVTVDTEKDNAQVILDVGGETYDKATVTNLVSNQIYQNQYMNQLYASVGMQGSLPTDTASVTDQVIKDLTISAVEKQKAKSLGLDQLNDEDKAAAEETGKKNYDSFIESVISTYLSGLKLEGEELTKAAEKYVAENDVANIFGFSTLEDYIQDAINTKAVEQLENDVTKDLAVTEEEVKADYDSKVEAAKTQMEESPDLYGSYRTNGTTAYYVPAGYRMVKHILIKFSDEDQTAVNEKSTALSDAKSALEAAQALVDQPAEDADLDALKAAVTEAEAKVAEAQTALDEMKAAAYANIKEKAEEAYAKATAEGADFDALVKEYNQDTGMPEEGYAIREGYAYFVESFVTAGMALTEPGQVSGLVESDYGYHIIQYVSDVAEGAIDFESVRAQIENTLLTARKNEVLEATKEQWLAEADVKTFLDRLN